MNNITVKFGQEEIISRIPSLFSYIEFDDLGISHLKPAHESLNGTYGKIVAGVNIPDDVNGNFKFGDSTIDLVSAGDRYAYSTLMFYYNNYKQYVTDNSFIEFMEKGIGKQLVDAPIDWDVCDLVPEYVYLSECGNMFNEMTNMKTSIDYYYTIKSINNEVNCEMECLIDKYKRMGGDIMRDFYKAKNDEAVQISNEYFDYACADLPVIRFDLLITHKQKDLGYKETYINYFVPGELYTKGTIVTYNNRSYICINDTRGEWNPVYEEYEFDYNNFNLLVEDYSSIQMDIDDQIVGTTNSKLNGFKRKKNYLNLSGSIEVPMIGRDWLYYYRIGSLGHYETATDNLGNIVIIDGETRNENIGQKEKHLLAYGDIITDITYDDTEKTITFKYVIGCNLMAELIDIEIDDDGNSKYKYGDYEYNPDDEHGLICEETYHYDIDGDIDELIKNNDFDNYVRSEEIPNDYLFKKMEFDLEDNMEMFTTIYNGTVTTYNYPITNFTADLTLPKDSLMAPTTHIDYLTGISYIPHINKDVFVNRGNASAWERHMKLGEVKTFEDLENYSNGGFFNIL